MVTIVCAPKDTCLRARRSGGFTLIELVVVMTLIALLLSIAAPRYFQIIDSNRERVQRQNLSVMRDAIDKFYGDLGRYPDTLEELVTLRYLREVPMDPVTEQRNWAVIEPSDTKMGAVYDIRPLAAAEGAASAPGGNP